MTEELKPSATPIQATLVPVKVWIEKDMMGTVHIKRQNEGGPAFDFIQIQYSHMHTCNAFQHGLAEQIVALLNGAALTAAQPAPGVPEAFEAWATSLGYNTERDRFQRDMYLSTLTWELWRAWQARASLPTPPAQAAQVPVLARSLSEWHEEDGTVIWWAWNGEARGWAGEAAYIGSPLCDDWPGYHTHWTPHPSQPVLTAAQQGGDHV